MPAWLNSDLSMKNCLCMLVCLGTIFLGAFTSNAQVRSYHIGNSLTNDSLGNLKRSTESSGLQEIAASYGQQLSIGFHIDSGRSLHTIWENPQGYGKEGINLTRAPYNGFSNALPNYTWDAVVLQPYMSKGATLGSDKQMIANFAAMTSGNPNFYILQIWPQQKWAAREGSYQNYWDGSSVHHDSTPMQPRRAYYQNLMSELDSRYRMIPIGEIFYEVAEAIEEGEFPELTGMSDFYRDNVHLSQKLGRYVATTALYATMYDHDIRDLTPPKTFLDPSSPTPTVMKRLNEIIWEVLTSDPYSGISNTRK